MQISRAIRQVMREKGVSLLTMAKALGKERGSDITHACINLICPLKKPSKCWMSSATK